MTSTKAQRSSGLRLPLTRGYLDKPVPMLPARARRVTQAAAAEATSLGAFHARGLKAGPEADARRGRSHARRAVLQESCGRIDAWDGRSLTPDQYSGEMRLAWPGAILIGGIAGAMAVGLVLRVGGYAVQSVDERSRLPDLKCRRLPGSTRPLRAQLDRSSPNGLSLPVRPGEADNRPHRL
jgi:hypothetical protein